MSRGRSIVGDGLLLIFVIGWMVGRPPAHIWDVVAGVILAGVIIGLLEFGLWIRRL